MFSRAPPPDPKLQHNCIILAHNVNLNLQRLVFTSVLHDPGVDPRAGWGRNPATPGSPPQPRKRPHGVDPATPRGRDPVMTTGYCTGKGISWDLQSDDVSLIDI